MGTTPTPTPSEQQRIVTVLHVDVSAYAELVEADQGSEATRAALAELWRWGQELVTSHGGSLLTRHDRDATALWGATSAREDDAEQAVRATLAIRDGLQARAANLLAPDEPTPLASGVHTSTTLISLGDGATPPAARASPS